MWLLQRSLRESCLFGRKKVMWSVSASLQSASRANDESVQVNVLVSGIWLLALLVSHVGPFGGKSDFIQGAGMRTIIL